MSNGLTKTSEIKTVAHYVHSDQFKNELRRALGSEKQAERWARIILTSIHNNPKLGQCSVQSFAIASMHAAQLNLEPGPQGLASIIPYKGNAQLQIEYRGLCQLGWRSGLLHTIHTDVVRENDEFEERIGSPPVHKKKLRERDRGEWVAVYAVLGIKGGGWITEVWDRDAIESHRDRYSVAYQRDKSNSPWATNPIAMAKKTVLKQAFKLSPLAADAQLAATLDDLTEGGKPLPSPEVTKEAIEQDVMLRLQQMKDEESGGGGKEQESGAVTSDDDPELEPSPDDSGSGSMGRFLDLCEAHELSIAQAKALVAEIVEKDPSKLRAPDYETILKDPDSFVALYRSKHPGNGDSLPLDE